MNIDAPFLFGRVHKVGPKGYENTNIIEFDVPYVIENLTKYPIAYPIGNHTHKLNEGDSVFITKVSPLNRFFYQPIDFSAFTGIKQSNKNVLELKGDDKFTLTTNGNKILEVDKNKLTISVGGQDIFIIDIDSHRIQFVPNLAPPYNKIFGCQQCVVTGTPIADNNGVIL